ncbi:ABC transporter ATP-binding protein [Nocardioides sp. GXZ039]|uniref:ABC transporter ATP-binding protein n=1 Tax=Nocardioides sp. GXZ039 TaxID=3136018 RepID=UPI0030F3A2BE
MTPERAGAGMLEVRDLTVRYGDRAPALDDVTLSVSTGLITGVLGGNGAGKTTLLRAIGGTLYRHGGSISHGRVVLERIDVLGLRAEQRVLRGIAQVPEGRHVFARLSVEENLRVGATRRQAGATGTELARVFDLFPRLADRRAQRAALLSGGEQQMLAIGRALMAAPRLLLLDEPTLGLAPRVIEQVADLLSHLRQEGLTIVLVEQNAAVALDVADRAYVLAAGRVALSGPVAALREDPRVRGLYVGDAAAGAAP